MKKFALAAAAAAVMIFNACTPKQADDDKKAQKIDTTLVVTKNLPPSPKATVSIDSIASARLRLEDTLEHVRSEIGEDAAYDLETIKTKILLSKPAERDALVANLDNIMTKFNAAHSSKDYKVKATIEAATVESEDSAAGITLTTKVYVQDTLRNKTYFENNAQVE